MQISMLVSRRPLYVVVQRKPVILVPSGIIVLLIYNSALPISMSSKVQGSLIIHSRKDIMINTRLLCIPEVIRISLLN